MTEEELEAKLATHPDGAWIQGLLEFQGIYLGKRFDLVTCPKCHHTRGIRRLPHFRPNGSVEYLPNPDQGKCERPKCR